MLQRRRSGALDRRRRDRPVHVLRDVPADVRRDRTGADHGRVRRAQVRRVLLFTLLWSTLVYSPIAHWVWSTDGWLFKLGALDFAGGTVVHICSGVSALVVALVIGRRTVNGDASPHNLPMTVLGAGLLWFGWFGFNAGSALDRRRPRGSAFMVTNIAAAAAR